MSLEIRSDRQTDRAILIGTPQGCERFYRRGLRPITLNAICPPLILCDARRILQVKFWEGENYNPITLRHSLGPTKLGVRLTSEVKKEFVGKER
jgi:hypothetical protein